MTSISVNLGEKPHIFDPVYLQAEVGKTLEFDPVSQLDERDAAEGRFKVLTDKVKEHMAHPVRSNIKRALIATAVTIGFIALSGILAVGGLVGLGIFGQTTTLAGLGWFVGTTASIVGLSMLAKLANKGVLQNIQVVKDNANEEVRRVGECWRNFQTAQEQLGEIAQGLRERNDEYAKLIDEKSAEEGPQAREWRRIAGPHIERRRDRNDGYLKAIEKIQQWAEKRLAQ